MEWLYSGAPQNPEALIYDFITVANRDSLYEKNQFVIDNFFLDSWLEQTRYYESQMSWKFTATMMVETGKWLFGNTRNALFINELELADGMLKIGQGKL